MTVEGTIQMGDRSSLRPVLRLLSHSLRRRALFVLGGRALNASEIALALNCTPKTARYHLQRLRDAGLVELNDDVRPFQYQLTRKVQVVRYQGKTVCSIQAERGEKMTFSEPAK